MKNIEIFLCWVLLSLPEKRHLHSNLRELFSGEVQRVVDGRDSILIQVSSFGQVGAQDGVVGHVHEGHHSMPSLIVVPHLWT